MAGNNKANIWKLSIFRSMASMLKGTVRAQKCISIPEEGIARMADLPMATGWMSVVDTKSSWAAIHKLKVRIVSLGIDVFFICDRSYIPLNPCDVLTKEEKERLTSLKGTADGKSGGIADAKYNDSFATCPSRNKLKNSHSVLTTILYCSFIFTAIIVLIVLMKGKVH